MGGAASPTPAALPAACGPRCACPLRAALVAGALATPVAADAADIGALIECCCNEQVFQCILDCCIHNPDCINHACGCVKACCASPEIALPWCGCCSCCACWILLQKPSDGAKALAIAEGRQGGWDRLCVLPRLIPVERATSRHAHWQGLPLALQNQEEAIRALMDGGEAREALLRNRDLILQQPRLSASGGSAASTLTRRKAYKDRVVPAQSCWVCMCEFEWGSDAATAAKMRSANERALRTFGPQGYAVPHEFHGDVASDRAFPGHASCGHMICKKCFDDLVRARLKCFCAEPVSFAPGAAWVPIQTSQELDELRPQSRASAPESGWAAASPPPPPAAPTAVEAREPALPAQGPRQGAEAAQELGEPRPQPGAPAPEVALRAAGLEQDGPLSPRSADGAGEA